MKRRDKYHPDYKKQYPGEHLSPEVMAALKRSDRKMEYMEVDLKQERFKQDLEAMKAEFIPSREDSYERLKDEGNAVFPLDEPTPEDKVVHNDELERLCRTMEMLKPEERALIQAIYFEGVSEREYAAKTGDAFMTVHNRKVRVQSKLKKLMEK